MDKLQEEFQNTPEKPVKKPTKKDRVSAAMEVIKEEYGIEVEPKNNVKYKVERVKKYLGDHYEFRFNIITQMIEYHNSVNLKQDKPPVFIPFNNRDFVNLQTELKLENYNIGKDVLKALIESKYLSPGFDPFKDYLYSLPLWDKDKPDHIEKFLAQVKLKDETSDKRKEFIETFKKWFVAMVSSLINERVVNQHCFVLVGSQGIFKTTFLNNIVPKHLQLDYLYSSQFNFENKDHFKFLGTKMLINMDELARLSKTDSNIFKTVLTDDRVIVRLPYGQFDTLMWRRASFCGSTNNLQFLTDETGNRRFLVFHIDNIVFEKDFDIGLIYAQALYLAKNNFQFWFDRNEAQIIDARNDDFYDVSIEEDLVKQYLTKPSAKEIEMGASAVIGESLEYLTPTSINIYLATKSNNRININETTKKRLGQVLHKLGYKKISKRIKGEKDSAKVWIVKKIDNFKFLDDQGDEEKDPEILI